MLRTLRWTILGALLLSTGCSSGAADLFVGTPPEEDDPTKLEPFADSTLPYVGFVTVDCPSAPGASAVALADLDENADLDLVISRSVSSTLAVSLNPTRSCPKETTYPTGRGVSALALADLNSD